MRYLLTSSIALLLLALFPGFDFAQEKPKDSLPYAGVELGGSGVKYVVFDASVRDGKLDVQIRERKDVQTNAIVLKGGKLQNDVVKDSAREIAIIYYDRLLGDNKLEPQRIRLVASSAFQSLTQSERDMLGTAIRDAITHPDKYNIGLQKGVEPVTDSAKIFLEFIDEEQELTLLIMGISREERLKSVLVDIGSGNVKCGYFVAESELTLPKHHLVFEGPPGTKKLTSAVLDKTRDKPASEFLTTLRELTAKEITEPVERSVEVNPGLRNRQRIYLLGGAVWAMQTIMHPEDVTGKASQIPLQIDDIAAYYKRVTTLYEGKLRFPEVNLESIKNADDHKRIERELDNVRKTFTAENLAAGASVLQAIADQLDLGDKRKQLFSIRDSHFLWITSYMTVKAQQEQLPKGK